MNAIRAWLPFVSSMWNVFLYGLAGGAVLFDDRWDRAAVFLLLVVINSKAGSGSGSG
jgi:hypothetical protein